MPKFHFFLFAILSWWFSWPALAQQEIKIQGKILDMETGNPISFAQAGIKGTVYFTTSDEQGNFMLSVPAGTDSIFIYSFGYKGKSISINKINTERLYVFLETEIIENDVIIMYKDEPEIRLVKKILKYKPTHHRRSLEAYSYSQYDKIKIGDKDYEEIRDKWYIPKGFRFFFENPDTLKQATYLPLFLIETIKNYWFRNNPLAEKEEVLAASVSGFENPSLSRIFNDRTLSVYLYDDYLNLFTKNFISPISENCFKHYTYKIEDSLEVDGYPCIRLSFEPKHKQELTLKGQMLVVDSVYAIKSWSADIAQDANINFITGLGINQEYIEADSHAWMKSKEMYFIHGELDIPMLGHRKFFGTKETAYSDFEINNPKDLEFYNQSGSFEFDQKAHKRDSAYWKKNRMIPLTQNDKNLYYNTDSLKKHPLFKNALIFFTGYKKVHHEKWQIGSLFSLYAYNPVEGSRFRLGIRSTPKWQENWLINSYLAYGTRDQRFKYGIGLQHFFRKMPRNHIGLFFREDIQQLTWVQNYYRTQETILSTLFKISSSNKLIFNKEIRAFYAYEWKEGLMNTVQLRRNSMEPLQDLRFYQKTDSDINALDNITTTELSLITHWGIKEKYLVGDYKRVSLGTPYPVFDLILTKSFKNILGSNYDFYKGVFSIKQRLKIGSLGYTRYRMETGKIWGKVPYPLLELHNGNQTIFYDELSYSTMNFLEFASDQYASLFVTHFFDGYFFNKIPLFRKLKWREIISGKILTGSLEQNHEDVLLFPDNLYVLGKEPYAEAGFGIDNIFKVIRVDFLWRLNYLHHPDINSFKVLGGLHLSF